MPARKSGAVVLPPLGSHMSIAGGVDKAPALAASIGATALQIFVKSNRAWKSAPFRPDEPEAFRRELEKAGIALDHAFAHACYLINLASPKEDVATKSVDALADELERCEALGLPGLVLHPGSGLGTSEEEAITVLARNTAEAYSRVPFRRTRLLFEVMAGQGTVLGSSIAQLGRILKAVGHPERTGVCLDTCHLFAAGYDIRTAEGWKAMMKEFEAEVGLERLGAFHLNDSVHECGSRKDRHEHIGEGKIGPEAFGHLLRDPRLKNVPMSLETDKEDDLEDDRRNLAALRRAAGVANE